MDCRLAELAEDFECARRRHGVMGAALAVSINGQMRTAAAGFRSDGGQPITVDTAFQPGSITKVFTAVLVMRAAQHGLLRLDDPLARYADELRIDPDSRAATITVRHLLTHTSGLWPTPPTGGRSWTLADFVRDGRFSTTLFEPGSQMSYCNAGYATLGHLLETAHDKSYADLLVAELIAPAGLRSTALRTRVDAHSAHGHRRRTNDAPPQPVGIDAIQRDWLEPSGSTMWTSAPDLVEFAGLLSTNRRRTPHRSILDDTTVATMLVPQISACDSTIGDHWGLGLSIFDRGPTRVYGHVGRAPGFTAFLHFAPEPDVVYALMMNEESDAALHMHDECVARYLAPLVGWRSGTGEPVEDHRRHVGHRRGQDVVGVYVGTEFTIRIRHGSHSSPPTAQIGTADDVALGAPTWAHVRITGTESLEFVPVDGGRPVVGRLQRQNDSTWLHVFAQAHRKQRLTPS